jgi:hypothetical protein
MYLGNRLATWSEKLVAVAAQGRTRPRHCQHAFGPIR